MIPMDLTQLDQFSIAAHAPVWIVVLARTSGVVLTAPMTVIPGVHWMLRILLSLILGAVLIPVIEPMVGSLPAGPQLAWLALLELLVGGLLGMSAGLIVAGARQAGDVVAAQAGLSTAALLDPETGDELTALGHFYGLIALAVFLAMDGPLVMIGALVESYRTVPAGGLSPQRGHALQDLRPGRRRSGPVAPGGRSACRGPGAGGHCHGLDRPACPGRADHVAVSSRAIDRGHRARLPQPGGPGRDALAGMDRLFLGILRSLSYEGPEGLPCPRTEPSLLRSVAGSSRASRGRSRTAPS